MARGVLFCETRFMTERFRRLLVVMFCVMAPIAVNAGVNRWTSGGPNGGVIRALAVDPANAAHVYAGTEAGVFRSVDYGDTWQSLSEGLALPSGFLPSVTTLGFAATVPPTLYAGGGKQVFRMKSDDSGWTATASMGSGVGVGGVYALAIDPTNPATIYSGVDGGIYKSTDAGASWIPASNGLNCLYVATLAIDPSSPATVYAGACGTVLKSSNGGETWSLANSGLTAPGAYALAVDQETPSIVYVATTDGVFRSSDGAATWTRASIGLPPFSEIDALVIDPESSSTLYSGTASGDTFKSIDGGSSWRSPDIFLGRVHALAVSGETPSGVFVGTSMGVFESDIAFTEWTFKTTGIKARPTGTLAIDGATRPALYTVDIDGSVLKRTDIGGSWVAQPVGLVGAVRSLAIDPETPNTIYVSADTSTLDEDVGSIFKSVDGGATWTPSSTGLVEGFVTERLLIARSNPATLYASDFTDNQQYRSTNGGASWTFIGSANARILAVDPSNAAILYAAANQGALKSIDGGATWTAINAGFGGFAYVLALTVDPITPSTLYCGTLDNGIFKSVDGGSTWTAINEGLPTGFDLRGLTVRSVVVDPTRSSVVYAATDSKGVFRSFNGGATWSTMNDGLTNGLVHELVIDATGKSLHAATYTGLFDLEIPTRRRSVGH